METVANKSSNAAQAFTAAQIAAALGKSPQAVRKALRDTIQSSIMVVAGNEAAAWKLGQLPTRMREQLATAAKHQNCRTVEALLSMPRRQWQPAIPLDKISDADIQRATKLRDALKPFLVQQHDLKLSAGEIEGRGVENYRRAFGNLITPRHWRELFMRTIRRDNGAEEWNRLEIYLPDRLKRKDAPAALVSAALAADFAELESYIAGCTNPHAPSKTECVGVWALALEKFKSLVNAGGSEKSAARLVRQFLFARASFLAASRDALLKAFNRKLETLKNSGGDVTALCDGRVENGNRVAIPITDLDRLRHSAAVKNGGRVDTAWREEYQLLSEATRQRYQDSFRAPAKIHELLNREKIDALTARHQGKIKLRRIMGSIQRDWTGISSMHSWVVDDMTSNIEVAFTGRDGKTTLLLPQIIAVMDSASRKWVGWTISTDKAPNAGIVCDAVLEGIKTHGVPKRLGVENGFVFGKSLLVNGKEDDQGRTLVVGLGNFGCVVDHFEKMNPQSKSELEYGFQQLQCLMERHPGYTGRHQMTDAPEEFKREKRLIEAGKIEAKKFRYSFDEFIAVVNKLILLYNATPQQGRLKGLSPDESFSAGMDQTDPPIRFTSKLEWLLSERQVVVVGVGGVKFTHLTTRQQITVRGGELVNLVGEELWAVMKRGDASMVTFMNKNFTKTFTMETCEKPSARESSMNPGSGTLAKERAKIREHERAISQEYHRLNNQLGNPRHDLLAQMRGETSALSEVQDGITRRVIINSRIEASGEQMQAQRAKITDAKEQKTRRTNANKNKARRLDIPAVLVGDDEQSRRALELLDEKPNRHAMVPELNAENNL